MANTSYFSPDYETARRRFRESAIRAGGRLEALALEARGPHGEPLAIDIAMFGVERPRRLVLHSSGIHGVEGFAGSAIQLQLLDNMPALAGGDAIVVVHALNPCGMAWLRRFNENNVDLNRNFRLDGGFAGAPEKYAMLDSFLNPRTPPAFDLYSARVAWLICRYGMTALKQSVAGGQYEFPKGLFFGGKELEAGPRAYAAFLQQHLATAERVIAIDVHTGLGKFGRDSLLVDTEDYDRLRQALGERVRPMQADKSPAYRVEGGLEALIFRVFKHERPIFIGQEFGTYGPTAVLHALREENRWHHWGTATTNQANSTANHATKRKLKETFCPANEAWREAVLIRGQELIEQAMALL